MVWSNYSCVYMWIIDCCGYCKCITMIPKAWGEPCCLFLHFIAVFIAFDRLYLFYFFSTSEKYSDTSTTLKETFQGKLKDNICSIRLIKIILISDFQGYGETMEVNGLQFYESTYINSSVKN